MLWLGCRAAPIQAVDESDRQKNSRVINAAVRGFNPSDEDR